MYDTNSEAQNSKRDGGRTIKSCRVLLRRPRPLEEIKVNWMDTCCIKVYSSRVSFLGRLSVVFLMKKISVRKNKYYLNIQILGAK